MVVVGRMRLVVIGAEVVIGAIAGLDELETEGEAAIRRAAEDDEEGRGDRLESAMVIIKEEVWK